MKKLLLLSVIALLAGCATPYIDRTYTAKSQDSRVQFLILHYTAGHFPGSLKTLVEGPVSSHYLVNDNPPTIYQLVDENRRSYHAGQSYWKGSSALNAASVGIEIVGLGYINTPQGRVWPEYPKPQIDAVIELSKKIIKEHNIRPDRVLGHSDIAPTRKTDPGPRFPWKRFAEEGLIPWPDEANVAQRKLVYEQELPDVEWFQVMLEKHGFAVPRNGEYDEVTKSVIAAFQMKYRPTKFDGEMDAETAALLDVMVANPLGMLKPAAPTPSNGAKP